MRYERRSSNSLWHTDWFDRNGEQIVLFEDDSSKYLTLFGNGKNATAKNAEIVLEVAIREYGSAKQLMTDHGTQFTSLPRATCTKPNEFQSFLNERGIDHIRARVKYAF